jgi:hypothetical protein
MNERNRRATLAGMRSTWLALGIPLLLAACGPDRPDIQGWDGYVPDIPPLDFASNDVAPDVDAEEDGADGGGEVVDAPDTPADEDAATDGGPEADADPDAEADADPDAGADGDAETDGDGSDGGTGLVEGELLVVDTNGLDVCSGGPSGSIFRAGPLGVDLFTCSPRPGVRQVAVAAGRVWIGADWSADSSCAEGTFPLLELDPSGGAILGETCLAFPIADMIGDGSSLLVLDLADTTCSAVAGAVLRLDPDTGTATGGPWCSADWSGARSLAVEADGSILVSADGSGTYHERLYRITGDTVAPVGTATSVPLTAAVGFITVLSDGRIVTSAGERPVGCAATESLLAVDPLTAASTILACDDLMWMAWSLAEGLAGELLAVDRDSTICAVDGMNPNPGTVWVIDAATGVVVDHYCHPMFFHPQDLAVYRL